MGPLGTMEIDLVLEMANFMSGMKKAAEESAETGAKIKESMAIAKEAVIGLGEALAVDYFIEKVDSALEYAEAIKKVAEQTGFTTTTVQAFNYAASQNGVSTEASNAALEKFTKNLGSAANGNQKMGQLFKNLGVTSTDANVALGQFANGLEKVPTLAQKAADVTQAFGKGAQGLTELLSDGKKGLDEYTEAAQQLGIVLDGKVIDGAVDAEHKITALKMVISAEWASVIDKNATSIASLADSMIKLTGAVAGFLSAHPDVALGIMGAMAGGALGGLPGAAIGGLAGAAAGTSLAANMADSNNDLQYRKEQLNAAHAAFDSARAGTNGGGTISTPYGMAPARGESVEAAQAEFVKQIGYMNRALAAHNSIAPAHTPSGVLPPLKTHTKKGPRDRSADQTATFDKALDGEKIEGLSLKASLTSDPAWQAEYERNATTFEWGQRDQASGQWVGGSKDKEIDDNLAAGKYGDKNSELAKARADELKNQNDLNAELRFAVINRKEDDALTAQSLALQTNSLDLQKDHLTAQEGLARTAAERKKLADQILDIEYQEKALALQAELDQKQRNKASPEDIKVTQDKISALAGQKADAKAANAQSNMGPLASYLDKIPKSIDDINESLQQTAADGLGKFTDGIMAAVEGTASLGDAFKGLATTIITGIEKIVLEETIIKPLGGLLSGALGGITGGGGGGLLGSILGHRANGGLTQPGSYEVGERGPEIVEIGAPSSVVNHAQMAGVQGNGGNLTINSTVQGVNDPAQVRALAAQTIMQATPAMMKMSSGQTAKDLNRPRMR